MFDFQSNTVPHVSKVTLKVSNLERSVQFYQNLLGLKVQEQNSEKVILASRENLILTLTEAKMKSTFSEGLYHVAFILPSMDALAKWYLYQNSRGYRIPGVANHLVSAAFYMNDPDGNGVEVYADTNPSTWERRGETIVMDTLPLDIRKLTQGIMTPTKLDGDVRIGHLHLKARNVSNMKDFYQSLGMDTKLNMGHAVFMSYGGYHHHLGINQWNNELMSPYQANQVGIQDLEIRYSTKEELQSALDSLKQHGISWKNVKDGFEVVDPVGIHVHLNA